MNSTIRFAGLAAFVFCAAALSVEAKTINFSGYEWTIRDYPGGPGPNDWDENNVSLDANGWLHLKITHHDDAWWCSELYTTQRFGFGKYQFQVIGRVDQLDSNVVLGLFNYPPADVGPGATNEIDIEFARWGSAANPIGNYTVWPVKLGLAPAEKSFSFTLTSNDSTHRYTRSRTNLLFQSLYGHRDDNSGEFNRWLYKPKDAAKRISQKAMPVHMNLWLFEGLAPNNQQEVELVVKSFKFTPL